MSAAVADPVKAAAAVIAIKNFFIFNSSVFRCSYLAAWKDKGTDSWSPLTATIVGSG
jgi:hypothetical protein